MKTSRPLSVSFDAPDKAKEERLGTVAWPMSDWPGSIYHQVLEGRSEPSGPLTLHLLPKSSELFPDPLPVAHV